MSTSSIRASIHCIFLPLVVVTIQVPLSLPGTSPDLDPAAETPPSIPGCSPSGGSSSSSSSLPAFLFPQSFDVASGPDAHLCGVDLNSLQSGLNAAVCAGDNASNKATPPSLAQGSPRIVSIAVGEIHSCALVEESSTSNGNQVVCWGGNIFGQTDVPNGKNESIHRCAYTIAHHFESWYSWYSWPLVTSGRPRAHSADGRTVSHLCP